MSLIFLKNSHYLFNIISLLYYMVVQCVSVWIMHILRDVWKDSNLKKMLKWIRQQARLFFISSYENTYLIKKIMTNSNFELGDQIPPHPIGGGGVTNFKLYSLQWYWCPLAVTQLLPIVPLSWSPHLAKTPHF